MTYQSLYRALWALGLIGALLSPGLALAQDENDSALAECKAVSDPCKDANEILNSCEPFAPIFTCKGVNDVRLSFGETCAGECEDDGSGSLRCTGFFQSKYEEIAEAQCKAVDKIFNGTCLPAKLMVNMQKFLRDKKLYRVGCVFARDLPPEDQNRCAQAGVGGQNTQVTDLGLNSVNQADDLCSSLAGSLLHEMMHSAGKLRGLPRREHLFVHACAFKCFPPTLKKFDGVGPKRYGQKTCTSKRYEELLRKRTP